MRKYQLLLILFSCMSHSLVFSQYKIINSQESMIYTPEKINELNQIICQHLEKSKLLSKSDSIYIYHVLIFETYIKIDKKVLSDPLFFKKLILQPMYVNHKVKKGTVSKVPYSSAIIFNSKKKFLGIGYSQFFQSAYIYDPSLWEEYPSLIEIGDDLNIRVYFEIFGLSSRGTIIFGRTYDEKTLIFHKQKDYDFKVNSKEEFIEKYWDEYF